MTTNIITEWREAVQAHLQTVFPDVSVVGGRLDGVTRGSDQICVFWPGWPVVARSDTQANPTLVVRYFVTLSKQPAPTSPRDQTPLEQAAIDVMAAFAGKNRVGDFVPNLACRVASATPHDSEAEWFVEIILQAHTLNIAMPAA